MKKLQVAFIAIFLSFFFVPLFFFDWRGTVAARENRMLAPFPKNFREADDYIADRFGLRDAFLKIAAYFPPEKGNGSAIRGKDGWLFYLRSGNLSDFLKADVTQDAPEEAKRFAHNLKSMAEWCEQNGIAFISIVCPNKHSVYEEFYPIPRPEGKTLMDYYAEAMEGSGVNFVWPRDLLISSKKDFDFPLYYKTDTHWNSAGAKIISNILNKMIESEFPDMDFPKIEYETKVSLDENAGGDIVRFFTTHETFTDHNVSINPANGSFLDYYEYSTDDYVYLEYEGMRSRNDIVITTGKNKRLPKALVYRDSFFGKLEPFTSPMFSEVEYIWHKYLPLDQQAEYAQEQKEYILNYKPDILIYEHAERYAIHDIPNMEF